MAAQCVKTGDMTQAPLKIFVHIPKTAGSTLNGHLLRHYGRVTSPRVWPLIEVVTPRAVLDLSVVGRFLAPRFAVGATHIGYMRYRPEQMTPALQRADWVSGHIFRHEMEEHVARAGRVAEFYTIMRDPVAQLASHYQWWIEIYARGPWRYMRYERFWRDLSKQIRATDNSDPRAIMAVLEERAELFMNFQHGYIVGDMDETQALARYHTIGLDSDVTGVAHAMTGVRPAARRSNVSRSRFDRSVFYTPEMTEFLRDRHSGDLDLYERLKAR